MELLSISEAISDYIRQIGKIIHKKGHEIAKEYGLTYDQYHLLIYLKKSENPPTINDIASRLERAQNTVSEKISRLEDKGLVRRIGDVNDRRITRVEITDKGLDLVKTIKRERSNKVIYSALKNMEEDEVKDLLKNLEKLHHYLKEGDVE